MQRQRVRDVNTDLTTQRALAVGGIRRVDGDTARKQMTRQTDGQRFLSLVVTGLGTVLSPASAHWFYLRRAAPPTPPPPPTAARRLITHK